jgi:anti-anti-sigma regulatory factor
MSVEQTPRLLLYRDGAALHARILGPINRLSTSLFEERLSQAVAQGAEAVALDVGSADYLDSDGVRWLQRLQAEYSQKDLPLRLVVRDGCRAERTLQLLRLENMFQIDRYPAGDAVGQAAAAARQ